MSNPEVAILMLCLFIVLVLLGFPIAFTLIAMGVGFGYYAYYSSPQTFSDIFDNQIFYLLNQNTYSVMESDTLVAIPLFLFMGYVVERADIVGRLFRSLQMAAHNLPGSMAISASNYLRCVFNSIGYRGRGCDVDGPSRLPRHGQSEL